mmetsp:Transcript_55147/g.49645  ORF Transcript_55147/g.49645 Transcript_55147/m.49645 type:complete len:425 (-) Transcript_55147:190-1464(-)
MQESSPQEEAMANSCIQRLKHLKTLYDAELITQVDFETRKSQIVDELTGTSSGTLKNSHRKISTQRQSFVGTLDESKSNDQVSADPMNIVLADNMVANNGNGGSNKKRRSKRKKIEVIAHPPPDWDKIRPEKAEKWIYSYDEEKWFKEQCKVKIDEVPFDKGGLRYVFHLQDLSNPKKKYVAKMSQDLRDNIKKEIYFNDVRMQAIAHHFCHGPKGYNSYTPPKEVDFLEAYVLHLKQREGSPVCHVEKYIEGTYKKYNNNVGWVSEDERNTPHAFAHFTYEASKRKLLVCDIQGVGDVYTDPQVHSSQNVKAFGRGNLGTKGFENFLRTHRCNPVCKYLKLENINKLPIKQMGTLPANTQIAAGGISTVPFDFEKSGNVPLLSDKGFPKIVEDAEESRSKGNHNNDLTDQSESTSCWSKCIIL